MFMLVWHIHVNINGIHYDASQGTRCILKGAETDMTRPRIKPIQNWRLVNSPELAEIIGVDLQTVNNWIGRGIISRTPLKGRQFEIASSRRMRSTRQP